MQQKRAGICNYPVSAISSFRDSKSEYLGWHTGSYCLKKVYYKIYLPEYVHFKQFTREQSYCLELPTLTIFHRYARCDYHYHRSTIILQQFSLYDNRGCATLPRASLSRRILLSHVGGIVRKSCVARNWI